MRISGFWKEQCDTLGMEPCKIFGGKRPERKTTVCADWQLCGSILSLEVAEASVITSGRKIRLRQDQLPVRIRLPVWIRIPAVRSWLSRGIFALQEVHQANCHICFLSRELVGFASDPLQGNGIGTGSGGCESCGRWQSP